jgi:hypothetical protein
MESPTRLLRHAEYDPHENPDVVPTEMDWMRLGSILQGTPVYLMQSPDSTPAEIRSREIKRGMYGKQKMGGRPRSRRCQQCKSLFVPTRSDAKHCSGACRQKTYRRKKQENTHTKKSEKERSKHPSTHSTHPRERESGRGRGMY